MRRAILILVLLGGLRLEAVAAEVKLPAPPEAEALAAQQAWRKAPVAPRRLVGPVHYVGTAGASVFLITTPQGHLLVDAGFPDTVAQVVAGIEALGFRAEDVRLLLTTAGRVDRAGGLAELKQLTGAQVVASRAERRLLESGGREDFQPGPPELLHFPPVAVDQVVADVERVSHGGVTLTAQLTPGPTRGSTTWTMSVENNGKTYAVVFACDLSLAPGARLKVNPSHRDITRDYDQAFVRLKGLSCDIYFTPHPRQWGLAAKFARLDAGEGVEVLVDKDGWRSYVAVAEYAYRKQIRDEEAAAKGGR